MADPAPNDVDLVLSVLTVGLANSNEPERIARNIVSLLDHEKRLLPADVTDVYLSWAYRWRHRYTNELQDALHARHTPDDWVQERRRELRGRGEWKQIS